MFGPYRPHLSCWPSRGRIQLHGGSLSQCKVHTCSRKASTMSASDTSSSSWMCLWQKSLRTLMNAASNSWSVYLQITTHHDNLRPSCQITFCHSLSFATCGMLPAGGLRLPCIHQVPCGPGKCTKAYVISVCHMPARQPTKCTVSQLTTLLWCSQLQTPAQTA